MVRCLRVRGSGAPVGDDVGEGGALAVVLRRGVGADVDEAGNALVVGEAKGLTDGGVEAVPFGQPAGAVAERVGGEAQVEGSGAAGKQLLDFGRRRVR